MSKGKQGTPTGGIQYSPERIKRMKRARKRQEERWAAKAGPVVVTRKGVSQPPAEDA